MFSNLRILRDRSHGVPSWCQEILKDVLDKKQLIVVFDDGRPELRQSSVVPNKLLIKPVVSDHMLTLPKAPSGMGLKVAVTEVSSDL